MHALGDEHETPVRASPGVAGAGWTDQRFPFQRSTSGLKGTNRRSGLANFPTATQIVVDTHETAARPLDSAPAGLGVDSTDQRFPFQRSAKVLGTPSGPV
jgi:hypothetical protein